MAKVLVLSLLSFVTWSVLVEGRSLDLMEKELQKDKTVREMLSLLNVRKQLKSLKESTMQQIVITEGPSSKFDQEIDSQGGGIVSHNQLCSDAVNYLKVGSEIVDKRDLVINYVFNYCVKPSGSNDEMLDYLKILSALSNEMENDSDMNDWPNWPGFGSVTTPRPASTTVDYWQILYDELFGEDQTTTQVPSTTDWWSDLFDQLFNEVDDSQTTRRTETTTVTSPASSTEYFDVEAALEAFFELIEEENEESDATTPKVSTTAAAVMASSTEEPTLDNDLQALLDMLENEENQEEEEEEDEGANDVTTESFDVFGALWDIINGDDDDEVATTTAPEKEEVTENVVSNELPPVFVNKKLAMKKRLLSLLAESLLEKREQAMRK